jgi:hypothetical protein
VSGLLEQLILFEAASKSVRATQNKDEHQSTTQFYGPDRPRPRHIVASRNTKISKRFDKRYFSLARTRLKKVDEADQSGGCTRCFEMSQDHIESETARSNLKSNVLMVTESMHRFAINSRRLKTSTQDSFCLVSSIDFNPVACSNTAFIRQSLPPGSPQPTMPKLSSHCSRTAAGAPLALRCQLRRRAAARLARTLSLDAADGIETTAATAAACGRPRPAGPYAYSALAAAAGACCRPGGPATAGGLRAEVLRAALRRSGGCEAAGGGPAASLGL